MNACTGMSEPKPLRFPRPLDWRPRGIRVCCTTCSQRSLLRRAPLACTIVSRRCSTWRAIHAGAAPKKHTAKDPYLVTRLGVAAVNGFQGTGPLLDKAHVYATAKHFAVHGQPEGGTNVAPAIIPSASSEKIG